MNLDTRYDPHTSRTYVHVRTYDRLASSSVGGSSGSQQVAGTSRYVRCKYVVGRGSYRMYGKLDTIHDITK